MMRFENIPVNDVNPPIEIMISPFLYLIVVVVIAVGTIMLLWFKRQIGREESNARFNTKLLSYQALKAIDLTDVKKAAYEISLLGDALVREERSLEDTYRWLNELLEPHKYASKVEPFSKQVIDAYEQFCSEVYEKIS